MFFLPVAILLVSVFFLWEWSPTWRDPRINRILMLAGPAGFRQLDRHGDGVENVGAGTMDVVVAAAKGEPFEGPKENRPAKASVAYRDA